MSIDQGTTSSRVIIFDANSNTLGTAQKEHAQITPDTSGLVEHDANEIWANVLWCMQAVMDKVGIEAADLAAIGITNQRETVVAWDKASGEPIYNALVWQDTRGRDMCDEMAARLGKDALVEKTGLPIVPYFSATKAKWLLDNVPGARSKALAGQVLLGTIDTWLVWKLTGGAQFVTDVTNASRTLLMNIATLQWDDELCDLFGVPKLALPEIRSSSERYGDCSVGPAAGAPICGILGDQQAALFGQACFQPGDVKSTYGTGCFLLMNTGHDRVRSNHGLLTTVAYQVKGQPAAYALEGSISYCGALVQWLRDNIELFREAPEVERLARSVPDNGGVYIVPAFTGLYAPRWRNEARGLIVGLSSGTSRGHLCRAALEATAFQNKEVLDAMALDCGHPITSLRVDGGMTVNQLLLQFQADATGVSVVRPTVTETTALGAAYAAGLAVGVWADLPQIQAQWKQDCAFAPSMAPSAAARLFGAWDAAVVRTYDWTTDVQRAAVGAKAEPAPAATSTPAPGGWAVATLVAAVAVGAAMGWAVAKRRG